MYHTTVYSLGVNPNSYSGNSPSSWISCDWSLLRKQLLAQWKMISPRELDNLGPDRSSIARLIERKYGVAATLVENYLRNFERTMPVAN